MFGFEKNQKILDLGCGDGLNILILNNWGIKDVVGLDVSKFLINLAKRINPNTRFILGSATKIPSKDNYFDAILVDSTFHHLINFPKSIAEIKRVLKPNGYLCFTEPHNSVLRRIYDFLTVLEIFPLFNKRREAYLAEEDRIKNWLASEKYFIRLLKDEKFKRVFVRYDILSIVGKFQKKTS